MKSWLKISICLDIDIPGKWINQVDAKLSFGVYLRNVEDGRTLLGFYSVFHYELILPMSFRNANA